MMPARVKHIDKTHHACKEQVQLGTTAHAFCPPLNYIVDCLNKADPCAALQSERAAMGLQPTTLKTYTQ